jgi:hypothetical protein
MAEYGIAETEVTFATVAYRTSFFRCSQELRYGKYENE